MLWNHWWNLTCETRFACARTRTFVWRSLCLAGMTVRKDLLGVPRPRPGAGLFGPPLGFLPQLGLGSKLSSPALGALWTSDSTPASCASTAGPSSSATASRLPRPDARCGIRLYTIDIPYQGELVERSALGYYHHQYFTEVADPKVRPGPSG